MGTMDFLREELDAIREQGLLTTIRTIESPQGAWFTVDGKKVLNLCSNNYLGLANEPSMKQAAKDAIDTSALGPAPCGPSAGPRPFTSS